MDRRTFLAALGGGALTGCSGIGNTPTPKVETRIVTKTVDVTPTSTSSPTSTPSPEPTPNLEPYISEVALLSGWVEYGDVIDNRINTIPPDSPARVGARFSVVCSPERELRWRFEARVADEGITVDRVSKENEEFSTDCGGQNNRVSWEQYASLWYGGEYGNHWPVGEYTATVEIADYYGGETVSESASFEVS